MKTYSVTSGIWDWKERLPEIKQRGQLLLGKQGQLIQGCWSLDKQTKMNEIWDFTSESMDVGPQFKRVPVGGVEGSHHI